MRQRNDTGYGADVMAWPTEDHPDHMPFFVADGAEVDFPELIPGFTAVDDPAPATKTKKSASAATPEGGEPQ